MPWENKSDNHKMTQSMCVVYISIYVSVFLCVSECVCVCVCVLRVYVREGEIPGWDSVHVFKNSS